MSSHMSSQHAVIAIDQGTTGTRAILYGRKGQEIAKAYQEFPQIYPEPGWVEHDAEHIWQSTCSVLKKILPSQDSKTQIEAIGITNQRETTVLWDARTGTPVHHAIVWQDRRTTADCNEFKRRGLEGLIRKKTGLVLDAYFSAPKIHWLLRHRPGLKKLAQNGYLKFGTMDSWLLWKLTRGQSHATDLTNASRTLLLNIEQKRWDKTLLDLFQIPASLLPELKASASLFGRTSKGPLPSGIPIYSILGDQQAALYGQGCYEKGEAKNTYGTGCFLMSNLGKKSIPPPKGILVTLASDRFGQAVYALEGSIFIAGAAIQWLRDGLDFFKKASETEDIIRTIKDNGGVTFIPAFVGLGSPYWNSSVRGSITGITRGTTSAHITRAALEAIAHQTADVIELMKKKSGLRLRELKVDGGATGNRFLMQFQSDLLQLPVLVSKTSESTAWGAAKLAGRAAGFWKWDQAFPKQQRFDRYLPQMPLKQARAFRNQWHQEIARLVKIL